MSSITTVINDHFEVTEDRNEVTDHIADFIRKGVKNGDAEALVMFLSPAVANWISTCYANHTRKIRVAAAERVDGFGGPTTYPILEQVATDDTTVILSTGSGTFVPTGQTEEVKIPGLLDRAVLSKTYKIVGYGYISIGAMTIAQHQDMVDWFKKQVDGNQKHVDDHTEWIRMVTTSGASCLNDLV